MVFPRGIRLNNPGNIRKNDTRWKGMAKLQDDKDFVRFLTPQSGLRALMKTLITYEEKYDLSTISKIITRYAPPSENNTDKYIIDVSKRSGFSANMVLDLQNIDILIKFAQAIVMHENGQPQEGVPFHWYDEVIYHDAAMEALGYE